MPTAADRAVFDREGLLERLGGDEELLTELIGLFVEESQGLLAKVRSAIGEGDTHRIERAAHSLKGSLLNISAPSAAEKAYQLEQVGRGGEIELCPALLVELEAELQRLEEGFRR
jgi:HPt (histidine-containing phosphotransfer) domain-containing protein